MKTIPFKLKAAGHNQPTVPTALTTRPTTTLPAALAQFDRLPDEARVRLPIVTAIFGISAPTAWRWSKSGRLPSPKKLGPGVTAWRVGDLRTALARA